jgi:hypothetical protein
MQRKKQQHQQGTKKPPTKKQTTKANSNLQHTIDTARQKEDMPATFLQEAKSLNHLRLFWLFYEDQP